MLGLYGLEGLQLIGFRAWGLNMGDFSVQWRSTLRQVEL